MALCWLCAETGPPLHFFGEFFHKIRGDLRLDLVHILFEHLAESVDKAFVERHERPQAPSGRFSIRASSSVMAMNSSLPRPSDDLAR